MRKLELPGERTARLKRAQRAKIVLFVLGLFYAITLLQLYGT